MLLKKLQQERDNGTIFYPGFGDWMARMHQRVMIGWMNVSIILPFYPLLCFTFPTHTVYRVNWLRAKARYARWCEEEVLLRTEMDSSMRWHRHQNSEWLRRVESANSAGLPGHEAYARKQAFLWGRLFGKAEGTFKPLLAEHI